VTHSALVTGATGGLGQPICAALESAGADVFRFSRSKDFSVACGHCLDDLRWREFDFAVLCHAAPAGSTFAEAIETDLVGAYNVCMAVLPHMVARRFGRIVLFSSIRAQHPRPAGQTGYAAAKAGVEGLTRALAAEYGPHGITVNCLAPGAVLTPRTSANLAAGVVSESELVARTPAGRLATVDDVAAAVLWLLGDGAAMVNGQVITVDGGWSVKG
jgi:3-oxoacyl-[acyl-carrier protein] reductase